MSKMSIKFEWELIEHTLKDNHYLLATYRARVFDGWIVKHETIVNNKDQSTITNELIFISDPFCAWEIEK